MRSAIAAHWIFIVIIVLLIIVLAILEPLLSPLLSETNLEVFGSIWFWCFQHFWFWAVFALLAPLTWSSFAWAAVLGLLWEVAEWFLIALNEWFKEPFTRKLANFAAGICGFGAGAFFAWWRLGKADLKKQA